MAEIINDAQQKLVDECSAKLLEHFDSVRIFVSKHDGGETNTASYEAGGGNFYAQLGQVAEWLDIQRQFQKNHAIRMDKKR